MDFRRASNADIEKRIEELKAIHPKEIGMRAGEAMLALGELLRWKKAFALRVEDDRYGPAIDAD